MDESGFPASDAISKISRREAGCSFLILAFGVLGGALWARRDPEVPAARRFGPRKPFSFDRVVSLAKALAKEEYQPSLSTNLVADFEAHARLSYDPAESIAGNVRLFPARRAIAPNKVRIHLVEDGYERELLDLNGLFGNGEVADPAGFRIMDAKGVSDWLSFLGASYFRASGPNSQYGLSARAIAVNTALPEPEEFPSFTNFWIEIVSPDSVNVCAIVNGPSVCGAFRVESVRKKNSTVQNVKGTFFMRADVKRLGLAPITSMYDFGEDGRGRNADRRPEVHDSDGLAILSADGEWIWRPLDNPATLAEQIFPDENIKGFGLIQRDQNPQHYLDTTNWYEKRPSLWVEPLGGGWGAGKVLLYELHALSESQDNMVALWVSDRPARAGERKDIEYRLTWTSDDPSGGNLARCVSIVSKPALGSDGKAVEDTNLYAFRFSGNMVGAHKNVIASTNLPHSALRSCEVKALDASELLVEIGINERAVQSDFLTLVVRGKSGVLSETVVKKII